MCVCVCVRECVTNQVCLRKTTGQGFWLSRKFKCAYNVNWRINTGNVWGSLFVKYCYYNWKRLFLACKRKVVISQKLTECLAHN